MTPNLDNQQDFTPEESELCTNCGYAKWRHKGNHPCKSYQSNQQPDELEIILTLLRAGDDPETKQPHITWDEAKQRLIAWRDRAVRETQIERAEYWQHRTADVLTWFVSQGYIEMVGRNVEQTIEAIFGTVDFGTVELSEAQLDDIIKDLGLAVSGGDFTKEHFLEAKQRLNAYVNKSVRKARIDELERLREPTTIHQDGTTSHGKRFVFLVDTDGPGSGLTLECVDWSSIELRLAQLTKEEK